MLGGPVPGSQQTSARPPLAMHDSEAGALWLLLVFAWKKGAGGCCLMEQMVVFSVLEIVVPLSRKHLNILARHQDMGSVLIILVHLS